MDWEWETPEVATFRISVATTATGEIAGESDTAAGNKSVTFGSVSPAATFAELYQGGATAADGVYGLVSTFIGYVIGGRAIYNSARKVLTYKAVESD